MTISEELRKKMQLNEAKRVGKGEYFEDVGNGKYTVTELSAKHRKKLINPVKRECMQILVIEVRLFQ